MTASGAFTAYRVGERLRNRVEPPWEVFGERIRRYELHLSGHRVEMERGPIEIEGYGLRVLRPKEDQMGVGFAASTDLSESGIDSRVAAAEDTAKFARFPARRVELPSTVNAATPSVETVDQKLWSHPLESLGGYVHELLAPFEGLPGTTPSFGSVRATLTESTLTNSEGIQRNHRHTLVDLEFAVKSSGGPEGPAPGEYWVNHRSRALPTRGVGDEVRGWAIRAREVRGAKPLPSGIRNTVLPATVLSDVLPAILGFRLGGAAELRKMAPAPGSSVGGSNVTIYDDGLLPMGLGTAPHDDEGVPQVRRALIDHGVAQELLLDLLHASAFGRASTGNGRRDSAEFSPWFHFDRGPLPAATNLVVAPGDIGTEKEMMEAVGDGLWLDQLGYAFPDDFSGAFGGEVRIGYLIRGGKRAETVRGGTVGGVVLGPPGEPSLLSSVRGVGKESTLSGYLKSPNLWVDGLTVVGAD